MTQPTYPIFGHDLSCLTDEDPNQSEVDGLTCLAQALVRRLQVPIGTLVGDSNYGYDVIGEIDGDVSGGDVARICSSMDAEFQKDERVSTSNTTGSLTAGVLITNSTVYTSAGPFTLLLSISAISVALIAAQAAQ